MAEKLEESSRDAAVAAQAHAHLESTPSLPPGIAPNTELLSLNMNKLNTAVEEIHIKVQGLEKATGQSMGRLNDMEMNGKFNSSSVQELQGAMSAARMEIEQLKIAATSTASMASGAAAAVGGNIGNAYTSNTSFGQTVGGATFGQTVGNVVDGSAGVVNGNVVEAAPQQPDPWFGQTIGQPRAGIIGSAPAAAAAPALGATSGTQYFNTGSPHGHVGSEGEHRRNNDKWKLYDEKFILPPVLATNKYDGRKPLEWLQDIRDYVAGRTEELDHLLNWIEVQTEPIESRKLGP